METIDCTDMVVKDILEILKDFPMCELCVKDGKSIVILDHIGYGIKELVIEK
jgi:hypothetical protein